MTAEMLLDDRGNGQDLALAAAAPFSRTNGNPGFWTGPCVGAEPQHSGMDGFRISHVSLGRTLRRCAGPINKHSDGQPPAAS